MVVFRKQEKSVSVSLFCLPERGLWDGRDAFVWLGGSHKARQAGALVGPLCVDALAVLTQRDLVTDVLTFVDVCREEGDITSQ